MNIRTITMYIIVASCIVSCPETACKWLSSKKVSAFFGSYPYEAVTSKEYPLAKPGKLTIHNEEGNITIKTEWKRNSICLKATKRSKNPDQLGSISLNEQKATQGETDNLTLTTQLAENTIGAIDYTVIVPTNMALDLTTKKGIINVQEVNGPICATTTKGNIIISQTTNTVRAHTQESGSITIEQARGNIKAVANGNVNIIDAQASIIAEVQKGNILASCSTVQPTGRIILHTQSGSVKLSLPSQTNANFYGKTERGSLRCHIPITIKPITTTLTTATWKQFQREIDGLLGSGEAEIHVQSSGNITITPIAAT